MTDAIPTREAIERRCIAPGFESMLLCEECAREGACRGLSAMTRRPFTPIDKALRVRLLEQRRRSAERRLALVQAQIARVEAELRAAYGDEEFKRQKEQRGLS